MRRSSPNAARFTTIVSLFLLITLSFVVLFRGDSFAPAPAARPLYKRSHLILRADGDQAVNGSASAAPSPTPSSAPVSSPESPSSTPSSTPVTPSSSSPIPEVTDTPTQSSSSPSSSQEVTPSSSSIQDIPSSTPSQTPATSSSSSPASPSSVPNSSSSSSSSAKVSSSVVPSSISRDVASRNSGTASGTTFFAGVLSSSTSGIAVVTQGLPTDNDSSTGGSSFLKNTGAMVGTFVAVGVVALVIAIALGRCYWRRKKARRYDDHDIFVQQSRHPRSTRPYQDDNEKVDGSVVDISPTATPLAMAAHDAYPSRETHYGPTGGFNAEQYYDSTTEHGLEYPPAIGGEQNRMSTASNHAGYGVYGVAATPVSYAPQTPAINIQGPDEHGPAVAEQQSPFIVPSHPTRPSVDSLYLTDSMAHAK